MKIGQFVYKGQFVTENGCIQTNKNGSLLVNSVFCIVNDEITIQQIKLMS